MTLRLFCVICSLVFLQACATSENVQKPIKESAKSVALSEFDSLLQGQDFYNPTLPISLTLPEGWLAQKMDKSTHVIGKDGPLIVLKPKLRKIIQILNINNSDRRDSNNLANLIVITSEKRVSKRVATNVYNAALKKQLTKSNRYDFVRPESKKEIAGQTYSILPADAKSGNNIELKQDYYTTSVNNKLVVFILTYTSQDQLDRMEGVIKSASFDN